MRARRLLGIALFWAIFIAAFLYAQDVIVPKDNARDVSELFNSYVTPYTNATRMRALESIPDNTVDVAIIGSSTVFCGINPAQLYAAHGIAAQDYAVGAMTGALTDYVSDIVFSNQSPKYVFLDATRMYADFMNESVQYIAPYTRLTPYKLKLALGSGDLRTGIEYLVPLLMCHQNWINVDAEDFSYSFSTRRDDFLGMVGMTVPAGDAEELCARFSRPSMDFKDYVPDINPVFTDKSRRMLIAFRDKCAAHGAEARLIVCPSVFGNENARFLLELQAFAEQNGIPMTNFNMERHGLKLEPEDFADDHHLTIIGMQRFTAVLGDYMAQSLKLADRRGDAAYARYDDGVRAYENALAMLARDGE